MRDAAITHPSSLIRRSWEGLRPRWRLGIIIAATLIAGFGCFRLYQWWTEWPARLVLRGPEWHHPLAYSSDGRLLVTRTINPSEYMLWDSKDGRRLATWPVADKRLRFSGDFAPDARTFALAWYVASSGKNFSVDLIDPTSGKVRSTFESPLGGLLGLRFLDGGATLRLVATDPGKALVDVDVATGRVLASRTLSCSTAPCFSALSTDGRLLALGPLAATPGGPTAVTFWDVDRDREVFELPPIAGRMIAGTMAFSPDDRILAIGLEDGSIQIWDLATRSLRSTFRGHQWNYSSIDLTFSPDGTALASYGNLNRRTPSIDLVQAYLDHFFHHQERERLYELILIDVKTGDRLAQSKLEIQAVFSPDGRTVATSHDDGSVRVHDLPARPTHAEAR